MKSIALKAVLCHFLALLLIGWGNVGLATAASTMSPAAFVLPGLFMVGNTSNAMLCITQQNTASTARLRSGDLFTFTFDSSMATVDSVATLVRVHSSNLAQNSFSASLDTGSDSVHFTYTGASLPFHAGDCFCLDVTITAAQTVGLGTVRLNVPKDSSRFTAGIPLDTAVSVVDFETGTPGPQGPPGPPGSLGTTVQTVSANGSAAALLYKTSAGDILQIDLLWNSAITDYGSPATAGSLAWAAAQLATGGAIYLSPGIFPVTSQITLPNDGATPPRQKPIKIIGAGATMSGRGASAANGGTVLDLRSSGAYGKIQTNGLGLLEITGITFTDSAGTSTPFIYTTNTTLKIHENAFIGSKTGTACDQDCVILGGINAVEGGAGWNDGFQGYGTDIRDNYFDHIRRAVYGRVFASATVIMNNTVWSSAGSDLAGGAAIEFDDVSAGGTAASGNLITGNLIEVVNYVYGIRLGKTAQNSIIGNGVFDAGARTLAAVSFASTANQNILVDGFSAGTLVKVSDAGRNTHIGIDQNVPSRINEPWEFYSIPIFNTTALSGVASNGIIKDANGNTMEQWQSGTNGEHLVSRYTPNGGSPLDFAYWQATSDNTATRLFLNGTSNNYILGTTGQALWIGDDADQAYILSGGIHAETGEGFYIGPTAGLTQAITLTGSDGNSCTLTVTGGIITGTTCP